MFAHLHNITECPSLKEAESATYDVWYKPNQVKAVSSFNNNKIVKMLQQRFGKCGGVFIKNNPWTVYDWHTDIGRQCSLNWVLKSNSRAVTLYRELIPAPEGHRSITYNITEVDYTIGKPTLMDTTKEHCVINASDEERIIFSLSIDAPFNEVKEFLCGLENI
jgi:hypothetical protein